MILRDSTWLDVWGAWSTTPYARTSDIFWCSSVFGRTLASHWKHDHSVESNSGWNRASSKLVLGGWETYIVACGPQSYKGLGYIHWPAKQRIRCHGNTYPNTHCESFLTEHLPEFQKIVSLEFPGQFVHTKKKLNVQFEEPAQSLSQEAMISWKGKTNDATIFQAANVIPSICFWLFLAQKMMST